MDMDRHITASEANERFSEMLRDVAEGESFVVTSGGQAVARVTPIGGPSQKQAVRKLLKRLSALPIRRSGDWTRDDLYE